MSISDQFKTHDVQNQPDALENYNAWKTDAALREAVFREGGAWAEGHLDEFGQLAGGRLMELGFQANENKPRLRAFDRYGKRIDEVKFHPTYHEIMSTVMQYGMHSFAWQNANRAGAHVARAAVLYMGSQTDAGTGCPMSMTYAAIPVIHHNPSLAEEWVPKLTSKQYDPRSLPMQEKYGCTIGMGMTEKQGGSDVRSNTTKAIRQADGSYALVGHKWFFSAPMSDAHLVLAQAEGGLSCFLVPRILVDGTRNSVEIQRLKDKLGEWSNASSEVEFQGAIGALVGEEGRGIVTILQMVAFTRLDCMTSSASQMRQALVQAINHTQQRKAFGKLLIDQPLMRNVLADLALESEAAIALSMRIARAVDASRKDPKEAALARIATAIGKYWICKRTPPHVNEAQECLGGIGYVEETNMPRLYRQAPLNLIWEGAGNVQCLDMLRAMQKEPDTGDALFAELDGAKGHFKSLDTEIERLRVALGQPENIELRSRLIVERMALVLQTAILLKSNHAEIAEAFCRSRLAGESGRMFGTLPADAPLDSLIERAAVRH